MSIPGNPVAQTIRRAIAFIDVNCPQLHREAELTELLAELLFYLKWTDPASSYGPGDESFDQSFAALRHSILTELAALEGGLEGVGKRKPVRKLFAPETESDENLAAKGEELIKHSRTIETASLLATKGITLKFLENLAADLSLLRRALATPRAGMHEAGSTGILYGVRIRRAAAAISVLDQYMIGYLAKDPKLLSEWRQIVK
ncbi:MAG: hypothetical protein KIS76_06160 [Pyrinomonadaceae bacterium]|nr:hypothetical protein [Pyrinomonadaceae bacterium]